MARLGIGGGGRILRGGVSVGRGGVRGGVGVGPFSVSGGSRRRRSSESIFEDVPPELFFGIIGIILLLLLCIFGLAPALVGISTLVAILIPRITGAWNRFRQRSGPADSLSLLITRKEVPILVIAALLLAGSVTLNVWIRGGEVGPSTPVSAKCIEEANSSFDAWKVKKSWLDDESDLARKRRERAEERDREIKRCSAPAETWFEDGSQTALIANTVGTIVGLSSYTIAALVVFVPVLIRRRRDRTSAEQANGTSERPRRTFSHSSHSERNAGADTSSNPADHATYTAQQTDPPNTETLTCTACGSEWTRVRTSGRKPLKCPSCKASAGS